MMPIDLSKPGAAKAAMDRVRTVAAVLGPAEGQQLLRVSALAAERELALELSKPGTGRTYETRFYVDAQGRLRRGGERPAHRASAPGEPPAADNGDLRRSITSEVRDGVAYSGTGLAYGRYLEYGFVAAWGATVEPRPWMRTVAEYLKEILPGELSVVAQQSIAVRLRGLH